MTPDEPDLGRGALSHLLDGGANEATTARLTSIVARSRRRRDRRLKIVAGVSIVVALAGASVAGITQATKSNSTKTTVASATGRSPSPASNSAWTKRHQSLGSAPKGLRWSPGASKSASAAAGALAPSGASTFRSQNLCTTAGCGIAYPFDSTGTLTKLFVRTSGDVTVRAFDETAPQVVPEPSVPNGSVSSTSSSAASSSGATNAPARATRTYYPICEATHAVVAEVSNPSAVGEISVPHPPPSSVASLGQPFEVIDSSVIGVAEGSPIEVVTVRVDTNVSTVEATFSDGATDHMTVIDGWAVLVDDGNGPIPATLTALDASGNSIGTASVTADDAIAQPALCLLPLSNKQGVASGAAQSTSGSR